SELGCGEPDQMNLTSVSGRFQGDRAIYVTYSSLVNSELTRVAVCDNGKWVYMNDELNSICVATSFKFGRFTRDKYSLGEMMENRCV
ncbi:hypothetical protein PMAYCL1PPCAC_11615, partial [Pristionchus mayeri]